jgi:hypothetical protein
MVVEFCIEQGIPAPEGPRFPTPTWPFGVLSVGESFFVPSDLAERAITAVGMWKHRHRGWDYRTKRLEGGVRIWRTG